VTSILNKVLALASSTPDPHLLPTAECDDNRTSRAKQEVESARAKLREAQASCAAARRTFDEARGHEDRVAGLATTEKVDAALDALETARASRKNLRAGLLAAGKDIPAAADADFATQERAAEAALADARLEVESAEMALPALRARVLEAREGVKSKQFDLDHAAWDVVLAYVALQTIDMSELALRLTEHYRLLAAASEVAQRGKALLGSQVPAPPMENIPRVEWQFGEEDLRDTMRELQNQFRRLLINAEATI
jgi:hypothetical protein